MSVKVDPDAIGFVITDMGRLLRTAFERRIAEAGLGVTPGEARALVHVAVLDGGRQTALAERLGVEPMTVSLYLDRLEAAGLIERQPDPSDRRAKLIFATDAAEALIADVRSHAQAVIEDVMDGIPADERQAFEATARTMRARLQSLVCKPASGGGDSAQGDAA
jgi:MarR family transcriptional regulator, transcriptional regulator for hemolysin